MEHYISTCVENGTHSNTMVKAPLLQVLREALLNAPEKKDECWLISNGYSDKGGKYTRAEHNFQWIDTVLIDADNDDDNPDPNLLHDFCVENERWDYFIWETASSTPECPKFRAILLLDRRIPWVNEPVKWTKGAIQHIFSRWNDDAASWFFTPVKSKLSTFKRHRGEPYPSANIQNIVNLNARIHKAISPSISGQIDSQNRIQRTFNPNGWRHLPAVKHCLEGLERGERDTSLCKACYAMDKCGYKGNIPEFLNEVVCDTAIKNKFRARYR